MEKRIGSILILLENKIEVESLNQILSAHSSIILSRQGISLKERNSNLISLILEGTTNDISALTGKLGRLKGINIKSVVLRDKNRNEQ